MLGFVLGALAMAVFMPIAKVLYAWLAKKAENLK
jgi:hypothetical protein